MQRLLKWSLLIVSGFVFVNILFKVIDYKLNSYENLSSVGAISLKERERQLDCLSKNIYYEAATEPFEGKVAVAQVTLNRSESGLFPKDICKVVYQKNIVYDKVICQFSWFCETKSLTKPIYAKHYQESEAVAKKVLLEGFRLDGLKDSLSYHAEYVNPRWGKERIMQIGRHIFYKG
jgi:spore germination cell wall hydrolase CwlJ-like protein